MDFIFGIVIFSLCIVLYFVFIPNLNTQELDALDQLYADGTMLADTLMTAGYPENWTNATVERPGLVDELALNETKVQELSLMLAADYPGVCERFNWWSDFLVYWTNQSDERINISGIASIGNSSATGEADGGLSGVSYSHVVGFTRIITYRHEVVKMVIWLWE